MKVKENDLIDKERSESVKHHDKSEEPQLVIEAEAAVQDKVDELTQTREEEEKEEGGIVPLDCGSEDGDKRSKLEDEEMDMQDANEDAEKSKDFE